MKIISTMEKVSNYRHSQIDSPINAIAVRPNIVLSKRIKKNKVGLPGFILYLTLYCILSFFGLLDSVLKCLYISMTEIITLER